MLVTSPAMRTCSMPRAWSRSGRSQLPGKNALARALVARRSSGRTSSPAARRVPAPLTPAWWYEAARASPRPAASVSGEAMDEVDEGDGAARRPHRGGHRVDRAVQGLRALGPGAGVLVQVDHHERGAGTVQRGMHVQAAAPPGHHLVHQGLGDDPAGVDDTFGRRCGHGGTLDHRTNLCSPAAPDQARARLLRAVSRSQASTYSETRRATTSAVRSTRFIWPTTWPTGLKFTSLAASG